VQLVGGPVRDTLAGGDGDVEVEGDAGPIEAAARLGAQVTGLVSPSEVPIELVDLEASAESEATPSGWPEPDVVVDAAGERVERVCGAGLAGHEVGGAGGEHAGPPVGW